MQQLHRNRDSLTCTNISGRSGDMRINADFCVAVI